MFFYLRTIYYKLSQKITIIWIDINVVLFDNAFLMKMSEMSAIIITRMRGSAIRCLKLSLIHISEPTRPY